MTVLDGQVLTPDGFRGARVHVEDGRVARIEPARAEENRLILPGFIDLHCHGGGGADVMEAGDAARTVAKTHARRGTTAFLATTMTSPLDEIERALAAAEAASRAANPDEAGDSRRSSRRPVHQPRPARRAAGFRHSGRCRRHGAALGFGSHSGRDLRAGSRPRRRPDPLSLRSRRAGSDRPFVVRLRDGLPLFRKRAPRRHPYVQRHVAPASPGAGDCRRGAGPCDLRRADPRSFARASRRHPRRVARHSRPIRRH